jgi:thioesterase domain-containing protein
VATTQEQLERYLHDHIPLSKAMSVAVLAAAPDSVVLRAPLAPNINHRHTAFGGSISALAILSAWSLLHMRLTSAGIDGRLVIQRHSMTYEQPILGEFIARSHIGDESAWAVFLRTLARKGRARMGVSCSVESLGRIAGRFEGDFVALGAGEQ